MNSAAPIDYGVVVVIIKCCGALIHEREGEGVAYKHWASGVAQHKVFKLVAHMRSSCVIRLRNLGGGHQMGWSVV